MRFAAPLLLALLSALPAPEALAQADGAAARALEAYRRKDYTRSAALFGEALEADPFDARLLHDGACASALAGRREEAYERLEKAADAGYGDAASVEKDADLASLREGPRWQSLLARLRKNREAAAPCSGGCGGRSAFAECRADSSRATGRRGARTPRTNGRIFAMGATARVTMDRAGRLVVPKAIRTEANLDAGVPLRIVAVEGRIEIEPEPRAVRIVSRGRLQVAVPEEPGPALTAAQARRTLRESRRRHA